MADNADLLTLVAFDHLAKVPVHYARAPVAAYGTRGKGPRTVRLAPAFRRALETCLEEVWAVCPLGAAEVLVSGGCYVEKCGKHGEGVAIDIDALFWRDRGLVTLMMSKDPVLYLGVEAIIRKHFGTVLNFYYNRAHRDHWHIDDGSPVAWYHTSRSRVLFLQAALAHVYETYLASDVDGIMGPKTVTALEHVLGIKGYDALGFNAVWVPFLELTAKEAFKKL